MNSIIHLKGWANRAFFALFLLAPALAFAQLWTNTALPPTQRAELLVAAMTLDEKIAMVHGVDGAYVGNITNNARLGIPALRMSDGPAGVAAWGPPGITYTSPIVLVTAFPAPVAMAATWDPALMRQCGVHMAVEERGKGVHLQNAPMVDMVRAPQAGRAFEVFGEDPFLASMMAAAQVQGVQSQGVIANAKSFFNNDQETDRGSASSDVDARTQHEIYFPPFRAAVRAGVGAFMTAYNRVNGTYTSEAEVLGVVLKKQWGFDGFVMTDWWAKFSAVAAANNGLDVEMPANYHFDAELKAAVQSGAVPLAQLDEMVKRILTPMFRMQIFDNPTTGNLNANMLDVTRALFVRDAAAQGTVLLKNAAGTLPLSTNAIHSIAVIGSAGHTAPISVGGGSGSVYLTYEITPLVGISNRAGASVTVRYEQGDGGRLTQAAQLAQQSDAAIVFVGARTTEGEDRANLSLPGDLDALISAVAAANPRTIVVLNVGSAVLMPWLTNVAAVLEAWYPGQENGNSIASVLFGDINPSGRLPMTFPRSETELPTATPAQFPGVNGHVRYSEGLFMGYRWFDASNATPLFPFGHGLSYTTFTYSNLTVSTPSTAGQVQVAFDVRNSGSVAGAEVVQLYLGFPAGVGEPPRQLKGFQKVSLNAGQTNRVIFTLTQEELSYWDTTARGWIVPAGTFQVMAGASSRDLRMTNTFTIASQIVVSDMANAALNHPATASSVQDTNYPPAAALDGNPSTRWASVLFSDPQWLTVDLGSVRDIGRVRLNWEYAFASSYKIQVSNDNTNWTDIFSTASGDGGIDDLIVSGRGRYVRMYGTQRGTPYGYSLWDFEVYSTAQRPFGGTPRGLPARIEAEDYDTGGEGVAYHDTSSTNEGGAYRTDTVDIAATTDADGGYYVGWLTNGEWLEYTVRAPEAAAIYNVSARIASATSGGQLRVRLEGTILGTFAVPNTGGAQNWQTLSLSPVPVLGGASSKALRLEVLSGNFNLNWIEFTRTTICGATNLALAGTATASSIQDTNYPANATADGDPRTRWASAYFSDPQWLQVDLGLVTNVARVKLSWEDAYARSYQLQFSTNGTVWTDAFTTTNADGGIDDLAVSGPARYVRIYGTQRGTPYGYSLWDMEIFPALLPPSVATPPQSQTNLAGSTATFAVSAAGTPPLGYQWQFNGTNLTNNARITGAQSNLLTLTGALMADAGGYRVIITNDNGSITSAVATLTVLKVAPVLTWGNPANITYGTALSGIQLNATSSVPGTFNYTPPASTVLNAGTGQVLSVLFTPTDTTNYTAASGSVLINVLHAPLTVSGTSTTRAFGQPNPIFSGTIAGVQNGDPITATYACAATPASAPGPYPIVPTLLDPNGRLGNYSVTISNGVLTVAASAPSVLSQAGLSPLSGKANLSGLVFSGGAPCLAWIEWGGSAAYGSNTAPKNLGAGYFPAPINESLAGMAPGSVVHFRVVSSNSAGITYGVDQTAYVTANSAPVLANIARQSTALNTPLPVTLAVSDAETAASDLAVAAWSGNTNVVPQANLVLSGSGPNRTLTINPAFGQWGRAVIVVIVDDGLTTTSKAFLLDVGLLPGDIDENGMVDLDDYFLLASRWYQRNNGP